MRSWNGPSRNCCAWWMVTDSFSHCLDGLPDSLPGTLSGSLPDTLPGSLPDTLL